MACLRGEVRDNNLFLEFVKHANLKPDAPDTNELLLGVVSAVMGLIVLLGRSQMRLRKIMRSVRTSGICPYSDLRSSNGSNDLQRDLGIGCRCFLAILLPPYG